jgi:1,2-diacylglycerol 3-alpha-glucosyltransferase
MRIFFVTNNYTPYCGGIVSSINATSDALRTQGHEVFIITLDFLGNTQYKDSNCVIRIPCPIKFMYKKNHMAIPWRPTHVITQLLKKYKPDIVHIHHPFLLGPSALKAARACNIPCIFTYHTLYEEYAHYVPLIPQLCTKFIIRSIITRFCNKVDGIIAPSSAIKKYLLSQHIKPSIQVIPSPLDLSFFTQHTNMKSTTDKKQFKLLVVSRFVPEKNIPFVFDVFKQLPNNFTLTLIGYGTDYEAMKTLAFTTLQLSPQRVQFIHKLPHNELINYYRNANLFIFTSKTDTQGIVLAESMSQGLPIIAVDGPGQRDIIINGENGFIINDAKHAATTIMNIAQNSSLYNYLISGTLNMTQKYHPHYISEQLLNFYYNHITPQ